MSDEIAHHDPVTHMDSHTVLSDDDHGHAAEVLGPIDWAAWGYALAGVLAGVVVLVLFYVAMNS